MRQALKETAAALGEVLLIAVCLFGLHQASEESTSITVPASQR